MSRESIAPVLFHSFSGGTRGREVDEKNADSVRGWLGGEDLPESRGKEDEEHGGICLSLRSGRHNRHWLAILSHLPKLGARRTLRSQPNAATHSPQRNPSYVLHLIKSPSAEASIRDASSSRHGCGGSSADEGPGSPGRCQQDPGWSRSTNPTLASGWDPTPLTPRLRPSLPQPFQNPRSLRETGARTCSGVIPATLLNRPKIVKLRRDARRLSAAAADV